MTVSSKPKIVGGNAISETTWATKPTASEFGVGQAWFSDLDAMGYSDGVTWSKGVEDNTDKAFICLGGDHPNLQYRSGLHRIPLDKGLPWYVAINTHIGNERPSSGVTLTWEEVKALQSEGVEIVSHGVGPHNNSWRRISTGGYIRYTGDSSTASLDISGTWPAISIVTTLAGDQTDGSLGFTLLLNSASYNTVSKVAAHINTLDGWEFFTDPCLTGDEAATNFLIQASTNLKPTSTAITYSGGYATVTYADHGAKSGDLITITGSTPSDYNVTNNTIASIISKDAFTVPVSGTPVTATVQGKLSFRRPISAGAGLVLSYTGTAYSNIRVERNASNFRIYADGVSLGSFTISSYTLAELAAAITALGISGLECELCDDRRTSPSAAGDLTSTNPYSHGGEESSSLELCSSREITAGWVRINAGLPANYITNRRVDASIDEAALYGVTLKHFAKSGNQCNYDFAPTTTRVSESRGDPDLVTYYPCAVPLSSLPTGFHPHIEPNDSYGVTLDAHMTCFVDALADSPGFFIDLLNHKVLIDGTSNYDLTGGSDGYDLTESQFVELCNKLAANTDKIAAVTYSELVKLKPIAQKPKNYLFNPKFRNSGESLLGAVALTNQAKLPGIQIATPAQVTEASITNGKFTIATNSASSFTFLQWQAVLEPNTPYKLSCMIEFLEYTSGTVYWEAGPAKNNNLGVYVGAPASAFVSDKQSKNGLIALTFEANPPITKQAFIKGKAGTYNIPAGTVKIKYASLPYITGINLQGATAAVTTAQEVVNALNTAMAGAIIAGTYTEEWRNFATIENGRPVIKSPYNQRDRQSELITLIADTGSDQLTPSFGGTSIQGQGSCDSSSSAERFAYRIRIKVACNGKFIISNPMLRAMASF